MSTKTIGPEQFADAVMNILVKYKDEAYDKLQEVAKAEGRATSSDIKAQAPRRSGAYARGWSHKSQKNGYSKFTEVVYNRTNYQLAHLLEFEHSTGQGGHYPNHVDYTGILERINDQHVEHYMEEVMNKL